jgi:hypothetical protein
MAMTRSCFLPETSASDLLGKRSLSYFSNLRASGGVEIDKLVRLLQSLPLPFLFCVVCASISFVQRVTFL